MVRKWNNKNLWAKSVVPLAPRKKKHLKKSGQQQICSPQKQKQQHTSLIHMFKHPKENRNFSHQLPNLSRLWAKNLVEILPTKMQNPKMKGFHRCKEWPSPGSQRPACEKMCFCWDVEDDAVEKSYPRNGTTGFQVNVCLKDRPPNKWWSKPWNQSPWRFNVSLQTTNHWPKEQPKTIRGQQPMVVIWRWFLQFPMKMNHGANMGKGLHPTTLDFKTCHSYFIKKTLVQQKTWTFASLKYLFEWQQQLSNKDTSTSWCMFV